MYTYEEFKRHLIRRLQEELPKNMKVFKKAVAGNNSTVREFLAFKMVHTWEVPILPLNDCYKQYENGEDVDFLLKKMTQQMMDAGYVQMPKELAENWELSKERIFPCLINRKWNNLFLENTVSKAYLDLAVICRVRLGGEGGMVSHMVSGKMLEQWGIRKEELFEAAMYNLKKQEFAIRDMREMIQEFTSEENGEWMGEEEQEYVMTSRFGGYGACGMLRTDLLETLAEKHQKNIYILPISIEEVTLVPEREDMEAAKLVKCVKEISSREVEKELRLSDKIYCFNRMTKKVEIVI